MLHNDAMYETVPSRVEINGRELEYVWLGPPPNQNATLVFLHEGLGSIAQWRDLPQQLVTATGCSALIYNRASYGGSDPMPAPWPRTFMHDHAREELPALLDALAVRQTILIGHSDGASIAIIYAGGESANEQLAGIAVMAPHVFVEELGLSSIRQARDAFNNGDLRTRLQRYHKDNTINVFDGWNDAGLREDFVDWNIEEFLPRVTTPMMVIQGEDDQYGTLRQVKTICASVSGPVTPLILQNCRHSPHRDQPEKVIVGLADFVDRVLNS